MKCQTSLCCYHKGDTFCGQRQTEIKWRLFKSIFLLSHLPQAHQESWLKTVNDRELPWDRIEEIRVIKMLLGLTLAISFHKCAGKFSCNRIHKLLTLELFLSFFFSWEPAQPVERMSMSPFNGQKGSLIRQCTFEQNQPFFFLSKVTKGWLGVGEREGGRGKAKQRFLR